MRPAVGLFIFVHKGIDVTLAIKCEDGIEEFSYEIKKGRNGEYTKELWIDRREKSKSLAWSSVLLALGNVKEAGAVVDRPKALGDIRGVTYIYGVFYRFGLIDVPDEVKEKMNKCGCVAKSLYTGAYICNCRVIS